MNKIYPPLLFLTALSFTSIRIPFWFVNQEPYPIPPRIRIPLDGRILCSQVNQCWVHQSPLLFGVSSNKPPLLFNRNRHWVCIVVVVKGHTTRILLDDAVKERNGLVKYDQGMAGYELWRHGKGHTSRKACNIFQCICFCCWPEAVAVLVNWRRLWVYRRTYMERVMLLVLIISLHMEIGQKRLRVSIIHKEC